MIYEYTFSTTIYITRWMAQRDNMPVTQNAGLLLACKQLHQEALEAYYKHAIFYTGGNEAIRRWLKAIPECAISWIKEIRVMRVPSTVHSLHLLRAVSLRPREGCSRSDLRRQMLLRWLCQNMQAKGIAVPASALRTFRQVEGEKVWDVKIV